MTTETYEEEMKRIFDGYCNQRVNYKITIENADETPETAEGKGFIDPMKVWEYTTFDESKGTLEDYQIKGRGYIRWRYLALQLSQFGIYYMNVTKIDGVADATDIPSAVTLVVGYEQPASIFCEVDPSEYAEDEEIEKLRDGRVIFKGKKALTRIIAQALTQGQTAFTSIYNPTINDTSKSPSLKPFGIQDVILTAEPVFASIEDAEEKITIIDVENIETEEDNVKSI